MGPHRHLSLRLGKQDGQDRQDKANSLVINIKSYKFYLNYLAYPDYPVIFISERELLLVCNILSFQLDEIQAIPEFSS